MQCCIAEEIQTPTALFARFFAETGVNGYETIVTTWRDNHAVSYKVIVLGMATKAPVTSGAGRK